MARPPKSQPPPAPPRPPRLVVPLDRAIQMIDEQISKGEALASRQITKMEDLSVAWSELDAWSEFNTDLLNRIVDTSALADDYDRWRPPGVITMREDPLSVRAARYRETVVAFVGGLRSMRDRLKLADDLAAPVTVRPAIKPASPPGRRVFVVHGHDDHAKQEVARCLEKLKLDAIILHEQPNQGRTLIEKVEAFRDVDFAVVILTPDDVGRAKAEPPENDKPRPRQNVLVELGFYAGVLGRSRVCALHKGATEIPSDFQGVVWVEMDARGRWQFDLVQELKAAQLPVDANALLRGDSKESE